jgi:hypothetical protein
MVNDNQNGTESECNQKYNSFRNLIYNSDAGRFLVIMSLYVGIGVGIHVGYQLIDNYFLEKSESIVQQQVLGGDKSEVYIEQDGVKYYSHVDGKEISDLFK